MSKIGNYFSSLKEYSSSFWLLCLNMLVFMMSFTMLLPEMNDYISGLGEGGAEKKWMILGVWTFAAAIARPFSGKIADNISRKFVMYFGTFVSIVCCLVYPLFGTILGFLLIRFVHGFSTGFHPTGATALIADVIPKGKRGEAMGLFGVTISMGFSAGQGVGSPIKGLLGINGLFMTGAVLGCLSLILLYFVIEKNKPYQVAKAKGISEPIIRKVWPKWNELIAPEVIHPSLIMYLTAMCSGIYMMSVPDFSTHLGLENKGVFYLVNVSFMIVTRFLSGKFYDKFGARRNLNVGLSLLIIGALITGTSTTIAQFLFSSIVFGVAASICSPALFAWTADLANPVFKGRGMSTMFIALELGIASGTFLTQMVYNNNPDNFLKLFSTMAGICALGILYLFLTKRFSSNSTI